MRDVERLTCNLRTVIGIKEYASDDRAKDPAHAVAGLYEIDVGCGKLLGTQDRRVGISDGLEDK